MALHEPVWAARSARGRCCCSGRFQEGPVHEVLTQSNLERLYGCRLEPGGRARYAPLPPRQLIKRSIRRVLRIGPDREPERIPPRSTASRATRSATAREDLRLLASHGHEAYIVGGAVRDLLLGLQPEGLRRRHRRDARAGAQGVPPLAPDRPALSHRPRALRHDEVVEVSTFRAPRRPRRTRRATASSTSTGAWCATTSGAPRAGRRAARLHRQRHVLRPGDRDRARLPRRHHRREEDACASSATRAALPRGSGADAARGSLRRQARLRDRPEDPRADHASSPICSKTCRRRGSSTRC